MRKYLRGFPKSNKKMILHTMRHKRSKTQASMSLDYKNFSNNLKSGNSSNYNKNCKSNKNSSATLKFSSYDGNTQVNSNILSLSPKSMSFLSNRPRSRIKIREIKQENDLYSSIEKLNNKHEKFKAQVHKRYEDSIGNFKLNNFKEYFLKLFIKIAKRLKIFKWRNLEFQKI